jgi:uncharacterized delta-60 repeat protein
MKKLLYALITLFLSITFVIAQPGNNDFSFNLFDDGKHGDGNGFNDDVYSTTVQLDGKIIVGGLFTDFNGTDINRIARLNTDGSLDVNFDSGTGFNNNVHSTIIQANGKIVVGGEFTNYNGTGRNRIARLNSDGNIDVSFDPGLGFNHHVYSAAIQSDGKIIVGGNFTTFNGTTRNYIARLNTDGSLDTSFDPGIGFNNFVNSIVIQADGKIVVGGNFTSFNGNTKKYIVRLNTNGSIDTDFTITGSGFNNMITSISIQANGKIIVGGMFTYYSGTARNYIARLDANGSLDTSFNLDTELNNRVYSTAIQSDGKIVVVGEFTLFINGAIRYHIVRLNTDGSFDADFDAGKGFIGYVYSVIIQSDGKIITGGLFSSFNGTKTNSVARLNADGSLDTEFAPPTTGFNNGVSSTVIQTDGKIIAGGSFTRFNGSERNYIARLNPEGTLDETFNIGSGFDAVVYSTATQTNGKIIVGGHFSSFNGTARNCIARLNSDGSLDASFDPGIGFNSAVYCIVIQTDGKILIGGNFTSFNGVARNFIARLNPDGTLDNMFNTGTSLNSWVYSISIQTDGKIIIGGDFTNINGTTENYFARLNTNGSFDTSFNLGAGFSNRVFSTTIQPDGKIIVGGNFTSFDGTTKSRILRLNNDGSLDVDFDPGTGFNNYVCTIVIQTDGKVIIGGYFSYFNGAVANGIVRLNNNGSLDTTFNSGLGFNNHVSSIAIQADKKIIVGGDFSQYNGIWRNNIARLLNCFPPLNTVTLSGNILSADEIGAKYQWLNCDHGNAPIFGKTSKTFTPNTIGNYAVEITKDDGCSATSSCIFISTVLGIHENTNSKINIYPNPSMGKFTIVAESIGKNYSVTDNIGRVVHQGTIDNAQTIIDLSNNHNGFYTLIVENGYVYKLIKQ